MKILFLNKAPKKAAAYDVTEIERLLNSYASAGTRVEVGFPDDFEGSQVEQALGNQMMLNGLDHIMEAPAIIRKVVWAAENGYDAVIQSNTFDPGIDGARLCVSIPVLGPFRTSIHMITNLVDRIGIIVPLAPHVPYTWRLLRTMGMDGFVTGIKPLGIYGPELKKRRQEITQKTADLVRALVDETGAQGVLPLGGALIPYVVDPAEVQKMTDIPVFNTKAISIRVAEMCVALGLAQSALTYPRGKLAYQDFVGKL
ncbi:MAG: aspartate/glutamate racemase family protein [Candidatus Binatia bacterium]